MYTWSISEPTPTLAQFLVCRGVQVTSLVITDKNPSDKDTVNLFQRVANARTGNVRFDKEGNPIGLIKDRPEPREDNKRR